MAYLSWFDALEISIHALREEGDGGGLRHLLHRGISIHALREEGDDHLMRFHLVSEISIHALREEGDRLVYDPELKTTQFLSTPSARRATLRALCHGQVSQDFYPRPPRGGRHSMSVIVARALPEFLSTPSARRATAKTETKSLFSYKLYNILHEFRRALIYNGSKNYPNHAK